MICVSFMLAIFLAWPVAFGGRDQGQKAAAEARKVVTAAVAAVPEVRVIPEAKAAPAAPADHARPESCYKRFQGEVKMCTGSTTAACKLGAADHWDICEATGFWPS